MLLGILAGLVGSLVVMTFCAASGALLFTDQLVSYMPMAVAAALLGSALANAWIPFKSQFKPIAFAPMLSVLAIDAQMLALIVNSPLLQSNQLLPTVITTLVLITFFSGLSLYLMAYYHLGNIIRFIPYPVLGGILVSMGWLVLGGAFKMIADGGDLWSELATFKVIFPLSIAALYAFLTLLAVKKINHFLTFPIILVGVIVLTHAGLSFFQISHDKSVELGWLFPNFSQQTFYSQLDHQFFYHINWSIILGLSGYFATAIVMFIVSTLLSIAAIEIDFNQEGVLDRELKVQAGPNLLSGLLLGLNSAVSVSTSFLIKGMRYEGRVSGLIIAVICALVLVTHVSPLGLIPKFVVSGLLLYVAMGIFLDWLILSWFRMPHLDYLLIWLILGTTILKGLMSGLFVGIVAAGFIFIFVYRQLNSIRYSLPGDNFSSNVMRSSYQQNILQEHLQQLYVYKLQGYIFFGSANNLLTQIREVFKDKERPIRFVILDFSLVTGLDSSTCLSFARLMQTAAEHHAIIIYTGVSSKNDKLFYLSQIKSHKHALFLSDLEHGLEWVEELILEEQQIEPGVEADFLLGQFKNQEDYAAFMQEFVRVEGEPDTYLCKQGEASDELFYLESGTVSVILTDALGNQKRLRTITFGSFLGEMGFYLNVPRSAAIVVVESAVYYKLSRADYLNLQHNRPDLALQFQGILIKILCERVLHSNLSMF